MDKIQRKQGYYWVRYLSLWHIAEWNGRGWFVSGETQEVPDEFWKEIDEKEITRE